MGFTCRGEYLYWRLFATSCEFIQQSRKHWKYDVLSKKLSVGVWKLYFIKFSL